MEVVGYACMCHSHDYGVYRYIASRPEETTYSSYGATSLVISTNTMQSMEMILQTEKGACKSQLGLKAKY